MVAQAEPEKGDAADASWEIRSPWGDFFFLQKRNETRYEDEAGAKLDKHEPE
jgi:hypothetical protein